MLVNSKSLFTLHSCPTNIDVISDSFLEELADRVDSISVSSGNTEGLFSQDMLCQSSDNLFCRILKKRCSYLDMSDAVLDMKLHPAIRLSSVSFDYWQSFFCDSKVLIWIISQRFMKYRKHGGNTLLFQNLHVGLRGMKDFYFAASSTRPSNHIEMHMSHLIDVHQDSFFSDRKLIEIRKGMMRTRW